MKYYSVWKHIRLDGSKIIFVILITSTLFANPPYIKLSKLSQLPVQYRICSSVPFMQIGKHYYVLQRELIIGAGSFIRVVFSFLTAPIFVCEPIHSGTRVQCGLLFPISGTHAGLKTFFSFNLWSFPTPIYLPFLRFSCVSNLKTLIVYVC